MSLHQNSFEGLASKAPISINKPILSGFKFTKENCPSSFRFCLQVSGHTVTSLTGMTSALFTLTEEDHQADDDEDEDFYFSASPWLNKHVSNSYNLWFICGTTLSDLAYHIGLFKNRSVLTHKGWLLLESLSKSGGKWRWWGLPLRWQSIIKYNRILMDLYIPVKTQMMPLLGIFDCVIQVDDYETKDFNFSASP